MNEQDMTAWLAEQIVAADMGLLAHDQIAYLDENVPGWRDDDARESVGLPTQTVTEQWLPDEGADDFTIALFFATAITAFDAGTLPENKGRYLDALEPGWHDNEARQIVGAKVSAR